MRYIYNVRKDVLEIDEENHTVYGIDVIHNSAVVKSAGNLFCDRETAENFAKLCGNKNIPPEIYCRGGNFRQLGKGFSIYRYTRIT